MKKIILLLVLNVPLVTFSQSGVLGRFKQKVKNRVDQRVDEGMDKVLDKTEEKIKEDKSKTGEKEGQNSAEEKSTSTTIAATAPSATLQSYSRYDFIPGERIVYVEDFSQDVIGEFPLKWFTNNRGEVVTVERQEGKWLRLFQQSLFASPELKKLPENFTAEFDMILSFKPDGYVLPEVKIRLVQTVPGDVKAKDYLVNNNSNAEMEIAMAPADGANSNIAIRSYKLKTEPFSNPPKTFSKLDSYFGKPMHVAMWIQKERLRVWFNGEKMYDIPNAILEKSDFNRLAFEIPSSNYDDSQVGIYLSNIRIAEGAADMRSKLITEGKLVTNGILFNTNSDQIKPESAGVLQEIARVLKENASVKVKIIGHTDSDGDDAKNIDLSKRRALSVKNALVNEYKVDAARMETDGMGETKPVADNATKEGKSQNRRVEFIKQ